MEFHHSKTKTLLALAILFIALAPCAFSITLFDYNIYVYDDSNKTLTARCKSNGADVGELTIVQRHWGNFVSHVLVKERTVATCSMTLGNLHGTFDIFDWDRDKERCIPIKFCYWKVDETGLSLRVRDTFVKQFNWPKRLN